MADDTLTKLFEHNIWANRRIIEACSSLTDEQLNATPRKAAWSIRRTLTHIVESQCGYVALLTLPPESRLSVPLSFVDLRSAADESGATLLALVRDRTNRDVAKRLRTRDGYLVEPWVVMVQAINHATEHRRQINGMLRAFGNAPPRIDGWAFGEDESALVPTAT